MRWILVNYSHLTVEFDGKWIEVRRDDGLFGCRTADKMVGRVESAGRPSEMIRWAKKG